MFKQIKEFFTGKPAEVVAEVPYKVEVAPVSGPTPEELKVVAEMTDAIHDTGKPVAVQVEAPAKKAPAKKAPVVKKPRAPKAVK